MNNSTLTNGVCAAASGAGWSAYSLQGKARDRNSDAFATFESDKWRAFAVADGVGSMPGAPAASRAAVDAAVESVRSGHFAGSRDAEEVMQGIDAAVGDALGVEDTPGATTLAFVAITGGRVVVLSVGDSEIHSVGSAGPSELINPLDHIPSQPNVLLAWLDGKTPFETHVEGLELGDSYLCLMSDGVPAVLAREKIAEIVRATRVEGAARAVVLAARDAGAGDDLTAIVVGPDGNG